MEQDHWYLGDMRRIHTNYKVLLSLKHECVGEYWRFMRGTLKFQTRLYIFIFVEGLTNKVKHKSSLHEVQTCWAGLMVTKNTILDKRGGGFMQLVASQGVSYSTGG